MSVTRKIALPHTERHWHQWVEEATYDDRARRHVKHACTTPGCDEAVARRPALA